MEKERFDNWDFFLYDAYFFFSKLKILVFIKNASQVAILKIEHCKFCIC